MSLPKLRAVISLSSFKNLMENAVRHSSFSKLWRERIFQKNLNQSLYPVLYIYLENMYSHFRFKAILFWSMYLVFFSVLLELYERHQMHDSFELLRYYQNWMLFLITRYALYSKFTTFPFRKMIIQVSVAMLLCLLHVWTNTNNFSICWFLEDLLWDSVLMW